jgi:hypothetical protein
MDPNRCDPFQPVEDQGIASDSNANLLFADRVDDLSRRMLCVDTRALREFVVALGGLDVIRLGERRLDHLRANCARMHARDADSVQNPFRKERFGERLDGALRRAVRRLPRQPGESRHAREVHDVGGVRLEELVAEEVAAVDHTPEVDSDHSFPVAQTMRREALLDRDARIVDEDVDAPMCLDDLAREGLHPIGVGYIRYVLTDPDSSIRYGLGRLLDCPGIHVDQGEMAAV